MNNSDGTTASLSKQNKSLSIKFDMKERGRDLLQPFYLYENYAWWFEERAMTKQRFGDRKAKPKFEEILM